MRKDLVLENGVAVWVESFTGTVLEARVWSETTISSTPNAGYVHSSGAMIGGGSSVRSKTTEKREIWLKADDNTEKCFSFKNLDLQTREGHRITVIKGGTPKNTEGTYLSVHLHTTGEIHDFTDKAIEDTMYSMGIFSRLLQFVRIFTYIGLTCFFVGIVISPISATVIYFLRKPVKADLKLKLKALLPSMLAGTGSIATQVASDTQKYQKAVA